MVMKMDFANFGIPNNNVNHMKKLLTSLVMFLFITNYCVSQDSKAVYDTTIITDPQNFDLVTIEVKNPEGRLVETGRLLNNKKHGVFRTYDEFNNISKIQEFYNGLPDGVCLQFASNGALNSEENYKYGKLSGKTVVYRFGGIKKLIENYSDGKLTGTRTVFYDNGFKQEEANYKAGLRDGITRWYNQSEIITIEYNYREGKLHGPARTNYYSGSLESEGAYENDLETGEWKYFDADGKHIRSVFFKEGKQIKEIKK